MTPVMQKVYPAEGRAGDCLRACLASILDAPAESVPHLMDRPDWREQLGRWLEEERGLTLLEIDLLAEGMPLKPLPARMYCIVAGTTRRHPDRLHAVVARTYGGGLKWQYLHDPHPSREFIRKPEKLFLLALADPRYFR